MLEVLARREARAKLQQKLLMQADFPLVSFTVVVPGPDKNPVWADGVFQLAKAEVAKVIADHPGWQIVSAHDYAGSTGSEWLLQVDAHPLELKQAMADLEMEHPAGRLWDCDVVVTTQTLSSLGIEPPDVDAFKSVITRTMVGYEVRKCLICERPSPECARSRNHSVEQLLQVAQKIADGTVSQIVDWAHDAIWREVHLTPKPGLVDAHNCGSHTDMDLHSFKVSAQALKPFWAAFARAGAAGAGLPELQQIGLSAESAMFQATGGVNTHKGAIYALGLLCAAAGAHYDYGSFGALDGDSVVNFCCQQVAEWVCPDFESWKTNLSGRQDHLSHGELAFQEIGATGARGMAASGFQVIRETVLPAFSLRLAQYGNLGDALRWALINIMATVPDTNVFSRGGVLAVSKVRFWAQKVLSHNLDPDGLCAEMTQADVRFIERNISPGGAADLLAVTWFLYQLGQTQIVA